MLNLSHAFGDIFCIVILLALTGGIISDRESEEKNTFLGMILAAMVYIINCLVWQLASGFGLAELAAVRLAYQAVLHSAGAWVMYASFRYLYLVTVGRAPRSFLFSISAIVLVAMSLLSPWTGWIFRADGSPGSIPWAYEVLSNVYLVIATVTALGKWYLSRDPYLRRRCLIAASFVLPMIGVGAIQILNPSLELRSFGITIAITSVFVRLQKQTVTESMLALSIQRENATRYRNTVLSSALQLMVVDLTTDTILELTVPRNEEVTLESLVRSGRMDSRRYADAVDYWRSRVISMTGEELDRSFSSRSLLEQYDSGHVRTGAELQIRRKDNQVAWCRQEVIMIRNSQTDHVIATITIYDITQQKLREQSIETQQRIIQALASGVSAYWILDWETEKVISHQIENDRIRYFSDEILAQGSYTRALDFIYGTLVEQATKEAARAYVQVDVVRRRLEENKQYVVPLYLSAQGSYFQLTFTQIYVGQRKAFIVAAREITDTVKRERKLRQELAEALDASRIASQAKTDFLLNMSHDIRTPMNAILGFQELAKRNLHDPQKVWDALEKSRRSGEHLLSLINDILDMSRIESGKMTITPEIIDIQEHVSRIEDMFRTPMEEKGLTLTVINRSQTPYVWGDYLRLTQIYTNLMSNAMKFTPAGGKVTFSLEQLETREGRASFRLQVRDTGIGMSQEFQQRMFGTFERENNSTVSGIQGTGLGLAITRNLAELMGGAITCDSQLGKGTEFTFTLSLPVAPAPEKRIRAERPDMAGKRVLLVEDNELNREIAVEILEAEGILVCEAVNGAQAVELLGKAKPGDYDVVLMDIQMPVMDGYQAAREIRKLPDRAVAGIPIVAMTADAFDEDRRRALEAGMNAHLPKPVDKNTLAATLAEVISQAGS